MAKEISAKILEKDKYIESKGGRKTAHARVRVYTKKGNITINEKPYKEYFKEIEKQDIVMDPFILLEIKDMSATVIVEGGGIHAQAEAIRNGIAKSLVKIDAEYKKRLRRAGFITRDARMVERKKPGLKKARRAPQWSKR